MSVSDNFQWDNIYGIAPLFLESHDTRGPYINRIIVANVKSFKIV